jgi:endonuclease/exonuclease/phosphatase family metal-dependent hydrolase
LIPLQWKTTKNIILAGDFNTKIHANDNEIQKSLTEITAQAGLAQIHEEPTREKNLLDLVFTSNATLKKSSTYLVYQIMP